MRKILGFTAIILFSVGAFAQMRTLPDMTEERVEQLRQEQEVNKSGGELILAVFRDYWFAKVKESNYSTLRPGSIYDLVVLFEQKFGFPRPLFNYYFTDTGLGAAEPLYPVFQSGYQTSWWQLLSSAFGDDHRHVDHYSDMTTPEGCQVQSTYWIRSIKDFPQYKAEMDQGYTLVDISFDYTTKLRSDAQCGRHRANEPDANFDPNEYMKQYADDYRRPEDVPAEILAKYEFKVNVLKLVSRDTDRSKWPRYRDQYTERDNSLWFYPDAHAPDFGINTPRPQQGLQHYNLPGDNIIAINPALRAQLPLGQFVNDADFSKLENFLRGKPLPNFKAATEPGLDTLDISEVTSKNVYTHGIEIEPIRNALAETSNKANFALISAIARPREVVTDRAFVGTKTIPQLRLVFQMMNPSGNGKPVEQLYLHVTYDAVDRYAAAADQAAQTADFMSQLDRLTAARRSGQADTAIKEFLVKNSNKPVTSINFSSSLTGIWVFGSLTREFNFARELLPMRIIREGIDVGFYSTLFDNQLFRDAAAKATGAKKTKLDEHLKTLTPEYYRDPRRFDVEKITFNKMTCAQCHQVSGRDGIHVSLNDELDRRKTSSILPTEFLYRELDRQMRGPK